MNRQQVYDKVRQHLLKQGAKSVDGFSCVYRSDNGMKCAIGALIPDWLYDKLDKEGQAVEGEDVIALLQEPEIQALFDFEPNEDIEDGPMSSLLTSLQSIHDTYEPHEWDWRLRDVARNHGLEPFNGPR